MRALVGESQTQIKIGSKPDVGLPRPLSPGHGLDRANSHVMPLRLKGSTRTASTVSDAAGTFGRGAAVDSTDLTDDGRPALGNPKQPADAI
ncbi:hypothetical protein GN958_ATG02445 [Phytophthora infestans]|uniref:Uncharacterized protein n=1 Tax=Phytophthora infestans TaxID=4787 RepID=A0A8S9V747_PHYIN|nr:hypothetical protein GN958_ATG18676 [Phytophthora infestans]KAF4148363.1 hypothetical protein GN958_ATG02445 [Phytophthora infestans]